MNRSPYDIITELKNNFNPIIRKLGEYRAYYSSISPVQIFGNPISHPFDIESKIGSRRQAVNIAMRFPSYYSNIDKDNFIINIDARRKYLRLIQSSGDDLNAIKDFINEYRSGVEVSLINNINNLNLIDREKAFRAYNNNLQRYINDAENTVDRYIANWRILLNYPQSADDDEDPGYGSDVAEF